MTFNSDKTEIMLFSNTDIPEFNLTFNERTIPITNSHKHLGVTFSMLHKHIQKLVWYKLDIISLEFSKKVYILTFEEHSGVCKYLTIYFRHVYSI
jgi:hypothetical protein